jgi:hypothetical protein
MTQINSITDQATSDRRPAFAFDEYAALLDLPLGKIVSVLARFDNLTSLLPPLEPVDW